MEVNLFYKFIKVNGLNLLLLQTFSYDCVVNLSYKMLLAIDKGTKFFRKSPPFPEKMTKKSAIVVIWRMLKGVDTRFEGRLSP